MSKRWTSIGKSQISKGIRMTGTFRERLSSNPSFYSEKGIFYQIGFDTSRLFTQTYLDIRRREQRMYDDATVKRLPETPSILRSSNEWPIRKRSANRLRKYFSARRMLSVVEVGCGNGWLIHHLSKNRGFDFCGVDINEPELEQAGRLFENEHKSFVHCDILSDATGAFKADVFILAGSIQYFVDAPLLLNSLIALLNPGGEIHILDSPFYDEVEINDARIRSKQYFEQRGAEEMEKYYFHHSWQVLRDFSFEILYQPSALVNRIRRFAFVDSPFPWIKVRGSAGSPTVGT